MLNVPVHTTYGSMNRGLAISLVSIFAISVFAPFASATGMQACTLNGGTCDTWDKADDGTENQQDWIVGIYEFDLVDTSTINMQMSWGVPPHLLQFPLRFDVSTSASVSYVCDEQVCFQFGYSVLRRRYC